MGKTAIKKVIIQFKKKNVNKLFFFRSHLHFIIIRVRTFFSSDSATHVKRLILIINIDVVSQIYRGIGTI